jgi:hypothetical protein
VWSLAMPRSIPTRRVAGSSARSSRSPRDSTDRCCLRPAATGCAIDRGHGPTRRRAPTDKFPVTAPNPCAASGPDLTRRRPTSLIRAIPDRASGGNQINGTPPHNGSQSQNSTPPTEPAGPHMQSGTTDASNTEGPLHELSGRQGRRPEPAATR